jgi:TonB-dependent SusC/RagA subfamily outer membrane receptor
MNSWQRLTLFLPLLLSCLFFAVTALYSQGKLEIIQGIVKGNDDAVLAGATVSIKGSSRSVVTDETGHFSIQAAIGETMVFTSVGYKSQDHMIKSTETVNIVLVRSYSNLEEVIMTGYTSQKVKDITGSVASVKPRDLVSIPTGQVEQMLQGRVAGLSVISTGEPGGAVNIRLHGIGNFGDVTPLYIIDGVPGDINSLNAYDIESLQVLKDAGAYSIYGVRGANGVIVVTTRKGRPGKAKISYDFRVWLAEPLSSPKRLSPQENADLLWLAKKNSGQVDAQGNPSDPLYGNGPNPVLPDYLYAGPNRTALFEGDPLVADSLYNLDPDKGPLYQIVKFNKSGTDWFHELYKPAISQEHTVNVSGGNEKNLYLFSRANMHRSQELSPPNRVTAAHFPTRITVKTPL